MKTAFISGASGFLGKLVNLQLQQQGYQTIGLQHRHTPETNVVIQTLSELTAPHLDVVINLAGAPIAGSPWTPARKQTLLDSRIGFTKQLAEHIKNKNMTIGQCISGSAIGYYGVGTSTVDETSAPGSDFSAQLCQQWEAAALLLAEQCEQLSVVRTGLVLHPNHGFLVPLKLTTMLGAGAVFGDGKQGQSWIDYRDWLAAIDHILGKRLSGTFNLTAPNSVSQRVLIDSLATQLKRPRFLRIPNFALAAAGEMKTLFIDGQWVHPAALINSGFHFEYPELNQSLSSLFKG